MKICQIFGGNEEGGLEKHVVELTNALPSSDEIHIIAHEKYRNRFHQNVVFHALDLSRGRRNPVTLYLLTKILRKIDPDIVHAHANKAVDMIARIRRFLPSKAKLIATLHSLKRDLKSYRYYDHVIGVSHRSLEAVKNPKKTVIYNGIRWRERLSNHCYRSNTFALPEDTFVIAAVGRLEAVKNFSLLIEAIAPLDVKLLLVGEGSLEKELKDKVQKLHLKEKVLFTGYRDDALDIIVNSDLFVLSSDKEGFPYVVIESLLAKVPVVSTDVSDMQTILPSGFVVPVGDVESLRKTIVRVKDDYDAVLKEYDSCFDFAQNNFTLDAMMKKVLEVYNKEKLK